MQTFKDTGTGEVHQFADDVVAIDNNGVYTFKTAEGVNLKTPKTLQPYTIPTPTASEKLTDAKNVKAQEISGAFKNAMATGHFTLSLGWDIDCRRSGEDNDESNMEGLLQIAKKNGLADTAQIDTNGIKGYDNAWHPATVADVRDTIIPEMCEYGAGLYQKKFQLQAQVDAVTLASGSDGSAEVAKVQAIIWS